MTDLPTQGPRAGVNWPAEIDTYRDPHTGARVHQLTDCPGADDYGYGYNGNGWYDDGRRIIFESNRDATATTRDVSRYGGHPNTDALFSIDVESGLITQLTDIEEFAMGGNPSIAREDRSLSFWIDDRIVRLDLDSLRIQEAVYEVSEGYIPGTFDLNADESRLFVSEREPVEYPDDLPKGEMMTEVFEAEPHTRILSVPVDGGQPEVIFEDDGWWDTHVDPSPTDPDLFMHPLQGPWSRIDDKLWIHDVETGERYRVRSTPSPDAGVGHQSWQTNGERINYHGSDDDGAFFGHARYDGTDHVETTVPDSLGGAHPHANGPDAFVTDGSEEIPWLLYYRWDEDAGAYEGPRKLATLDWSVHPHPRFGPDGSRVQFNAAQGRSSSIYLVDVPAFDTLPEYDPE